MINIVQDVATITTVPRAYLKSLITQGVQCVCHAVYENTLENESLTQMDIGIGKLYIKQEDDIIKYKFIPSSELEKLVQQTVTTRESPLTAVVEKAVASRIVDTYKDLL